MTHSVDVTLPRPQSPRRTCVACRATRDPAELLRFRRADGQLVAAVARKSAGGRSAWLCPRTSCFVEAERRRAFSRAFAAELRFDSAAAWTDTQGRVRAEIELLDRCGGPTPTIHPRRVALERLALELSSQPAPPERTPASRKGKGGPPTHA